MMNEQQELFPGLPASEDTEGIGSDFAGDFELLADAIGLDAAWKVAEVFAGSSIYIPKNIFTRKTYHEIRKKFKDGAGYRELSAEFGYTESHIRGILSKK